MRTLYHNASVLSRTEYDSKDAVTCLLVEDETIIYVGSEQDAPASDKQVDLAGRRVLPGFIDGCVYIPASAL